MISSTQIEIIRPYMATPSLRPALSKIAVRDGWFCATDSFRLIRTKTAEGLPDTKGFPDISAFMDIGEEWVNITSFMRSFIGRLSVFGTTNTIMTGDLEFPPGKCVVRPRLIFEDDDSRMTFDIKHPFIHTRISYGYLIQMLRPFRKAIDKQMCTIEYRQKNPLGIIQFRISSPDGQYEIGIMPLKI